MHLFNAADYGARRDARLSISREAIGRLPASAAAQAVAANGANSLPDLRAVVEQQAGDLQLLYVTIEDLLAERGL